SIHDRHWKVYEPYFESLVFDSLAKDVFGDLGQLTTLVDFASRLADKDGSQTSQVTALLLAGRPDLALEPIERTERMLGHDWLPWGQEQRQRVAGDIKEMCAEYHRKEIETAKEMKLGELWEETPFPAELPSDRRAECSDPFFATRPWVAGSVNLWQ